MIQYRIRKLFPPSFRPLKYYSVSPSVNGSVNPSEKSTQHSPAELLQSNPKLKFKKWTVVPQLRGRSVTTNRLWLNRFKQETEEGSLATNPLPNGPIQETFRKTPYNPTMPKSMCDSYVEEYMPFKSDVHIREEYINIYGKIRVGKLLEDLDSLSGSVAYSHCDDGNGETPPLTIVTASVDRIDLLQPSIPSDQDIRIFGYVTYVGKSSLEISLALEAVPEGYDAAIKNSEMLQSKGEWPVLRSIKNSENTILVAKFIMVARNPITGKAMNVNPLKLETELERKLFRLGAEHKAQRQVYAQTALDKLPPSIEEMFIIHKLYLDQMKYSSTISIDSSVTTVATTNSGSPSTLLTPHTIVTMKSTEQKTVVICMPQDRNIHNNIFGGYLMRQAYELSHATAILFSGGPVNFVGSEDITFKQPVPIGSLLTLTAKIVYVTGETFYVQVVADVIDPFVQSKVRTNEFFFAFHGEGLRKQVIAESYDESMELIGCRRKAIN